MIENVDMFYALTYSNQSFLFLHKDRASPRGSRFLIKWGRSSCVHTFNMEVRKIRCGHTERQSQKQAGMRRAQQHVSFLISVLPFFSFIPLPVGFFPSGLACSFLFFWAFLFFWFEPGQSRHSFGHPVHICTVLIQDRIRKTHWCNMYGMVRRARYFFSGPEAAPFSDQ